MVLGDIGGIEAVADMDRDGADWNKKCLGKLLHQAQLSMAEAATFATAGFW